MFPTIFAITVIVVTAIIYKGIIPLWRLVLDRRRLLRSVSAFPCPYGAKYHWLWGHLPYMPPLNGDFLKHEVDCTTKPGCSKVHSRCITCLLPILRVVHPETVATLTKTTEPKPTDGYGGYNVVFDWIGEGLLLSKGRKWFRNRRLLTPAFHFDILKPYVKIYNQCADILVTNLAAACCHGNTVDVVDPVSLCTLDIILQCAFTYRANIQQSSCTNPYIDAVINLSQLVVYRGIRPWLYPDFIFYLTPSGRRFKKYCEISHEMARSVIKTRRQTLQALGEEDKSLQQSVGKEGKSQLQSPESHGDEDSKQRKYVDFLDVLLLARDTDGTPLTDREIRDEVETFMFEGHDTTKSAISFVLYNLARHPEIQQRVQAEIRTVVAGRESDTILWGDEIYQRCHTSPSVSKNRSASTHLYQQSTGSSPSHLLLMVCPHRLASGWKL